MNIGRRWVKYFYTHWYIGIIVFLAIIAFFITSYVIALDRVVMEVDGESYQWVTVSASVADVIKERGITLNQGDIVRPALKTKITEGLQIKVDRSFPVRIQTAAGIRDFYTIPQPVGEVLTSAGIEFSPEDKIFPKINTVVKPDQKILVVKVTSKIITTKTEIEPKVEYYTDKNLERGTQKVIRHGAPGLAEKQIKIIYEDGRESRRYKISERIIKPAVKRVIAMGLPVLKTLVTSRGSYNYVEMKVMKATAYYPGPESCGKYAKYGVTYTGKKAGFGLVAVDPRVIKLGTKLYIEGYGKAEAADIGGAIKGNRIDLCFETFREAAMYGVKQVKVYILDE
ncbi:MAG: G5 domain-containing protein [Firmicutes bacterium]|nr:G5 domain-containing protein [Bacillota bacterium]